MSMTPPYKGHVGRMEVDVEAGLIHGEVMGLRDVITFQGETPGEAIRAFRESIDDYLAYCAELGREPEKTFSGRLLVRTQPKVHRALVDLASARKVSVNALVNRVLTRFTERMMASPPPESGKKKGATNAVKATGLRAATSKGRAKA